MRLTTAPQMPATISFKSDRNYPLSKTGLPFRVNRLENLFVDDDVKTHTSRQQWYGFYWITNGQGQLTIDLQRYELEEHSLIWFSPGNVVMLDAITALSGFEVQLSFDYLFMSDPLPKGPDLFFSGENCMVQIVKEIQPDLAGLMAKMVRELDGNAPNTQILEGLMKLFFLYLSRGTLIRQSLVQHREREIWRRFIVLVKQNFLKKKLVADYARELFITPNYLNRVVKRISGSTASYHIQQCIVAEAKRQAIYLGASMKEVAYSLGFNDNAHFSKFFKSNSGENFSHYRAHARV